MPQRKSFASTRALAAIFLGALLTACAPPPRAPGVHAHGETQTAPGAELNAELLYELLLARIAMQRGHEQTALDALTRAAKNSRRHDITVDALRLAGRMRMHEHVTELSALLLETGAKPGGHALLWAARARFESGEEDSALRFLAEFARAFAQDENALREAAAELTRQARATQPPDETMLHRFREAASEWPNDAALHWVSAAAALTLNAHADARVSIDSALQHRPGWEQAAMLKLSLLAEVDPHGMDAFAETFFRAHAGAEKTRAHYAQFLLRAKRHAESLRQFNILLAQNPNAPRALLSSGVVYLRMQNADAAAQTLQKFLALHPQHAQARLYLAEAETARENFARAEEILHAISAPPYFLDAQLQLAEVTAARDGIEPALRHLSQLQPRNQEESVRVILQKEFLLREHELPARALAMLDRALDEFPHQPDLLYHRGLLAAQMDFLARHERDMRMLIKLQPQHAHAYNALGYTLADRTARLDEALELITRALELLPHDPFILDSMGWVHFRLGNNAVAIEYLQRAMSVRRDAETAAHLGEALWVTGERNAAREVWRRGRELDGGNKTLRDTMQRFLPDASLHAPRARAQ